MKQKNRHVYYSYEHGDESLPYQQDLVSETPDPYNTPFSQEIRQQILENFNHRMKCHALHQLVDCEEIRIITIWSVKMMCLKIKMGHNNNTNRQDGETNQETNQETSQETFNTSQEMNNTNQEINKTSQETNKKHTIPAKK